MTTERKLDVPAGYDAARNPRVASFAAQLDDQLNRLKKATAGLETNHLEWQPHPGMNSVGMLLAHLAVVDLWWIRCAPNEVPIDQVDPIMKSIIGIGMDGDGLPAGPDSRHPATLAGKSLADYMEMLDAARAVTHEELRKWRDSEILGTFALRDRIITREWTAYHVLEHFAGHFGQVLLLKHMMRDAGILPPAEKS